MATPSRAAEVNPKTENYLFAAQEALADSEPGLALSLLRRAKAEDPNACIVEEYLCRTYLVLDNVKQARVSYQAFGGCMEPSDEPVLKELDSLLVQAEQRAAQSTTTPEPTVATPVVVSTPAPVAPAPVAPPPVAQQSGGGGKAGWILVGSGGAVGLGFGLAATLTWLNGSSWVDQRDQDAYERALPWNHVSVIAAGIGGGVAVTGLVMEVLGRRGDGSESAHVSFGPTGVTASLSY